MPDESPRWSAAQVRALAPDASSFSAGQGLSNATRWRETGNSVQPATVWGLCQGSGKNPYQTCVDVTDPGDPAYRCSCPSRKFPCKHAVGLLLLWSAGGIAPAEPPQWVADWLTSRSDRKEKAVHRTQILQAKATDPAAVAAAQASAAATRARRTKRVDAGVAELERWLGDQIRQGLAGAARAGYAHWDRMAARLVDAQAPGLASAVRRLPMVASAPERLLAELGLIWLLVRAYQRIDELPEGLAATVRSRVGLPVSTEEVLTQPPVRDEWAVVGLRDEADERLTARRVWLRGATTGRPALVLSFVPAGQPLPADLVLGTAIDADLCFYPGVQPMRALVARRHNEPRPLPTPPGAESVAHALDEYAAGLAAEPWLERWPMVLHDVIPVPHNGRWWVCDPSGASLPLDVMNIWPLVAAAGGARCVVAGEWSTRGLRPLVAWVEGQVVEL